MSHFSPGLVLTLLASSLIVGPFAACAQPKGAPAADLGWGSTWLESSTPQQRQEQDLLGKIKAAQQAHDTRLQLQLDDQLIALAPTSAVPYVVRANAHRQMKQYDQALADIDRGAEVARRQDRQDWIVSLLLYRASLHAQTKDYAASVDDLHDALKIDGKDRAALNSLAWLRATGPDAAFRNGPESVKLAQKAVAASTGYNDYEAIDTLAAAYAEANDYTRAVESERRAMSAAEKEIKDAARAQKFQKDAAGRLRLFEMHQSYHADLP